MRRTPTLPPVKAGFAGKTGRLAARALTVLGAALLPLAAAQELPFYDLPTDHWAYGAVRDLAELGVLQGYPDGRYDGTRAVNRYELAAVAARLLQVVNNGTVPTTPVDEVVAGRLRTVEDGLRNAASLGYARRLETRVAALEAALFAQTGEDLSVPTTPPEPEAAADATAAQTGNEDAALELGGLRLVDIRFSARPERPFFVGISPGVVSTAGDTYLGVQAGYDGLIGPVGPTARLTFNGGARELRYSLDVVAKANLLVEEFRVYGGLGVGGTLRPGGSSVLLEAPFGVEYAVTPRVGLFAQLTTSYSFAPLNEVDAELSSGLNLRF